LSVIGFQIEVLSRQLSVLGSGHVACRVTPEAYNVAVAIVADGQGA
jgi:hypothetical protein